MRLWWLRALAWFVFAAVPITLLCLVAYGASQQVVRQSANDIPAQMAADAAAQLEGSTTPAQIVSEYGRGLPLQDLAVTYSPWLTVYDSTGEALASTGQLYGAPPQLPQGVFANAPWWSRGHTWQPQAGLRFDIAVAKYSGGYVVSGQSLALAESHVAHIGGLVFIAWLCILVATLIASFVINLVLAGLF